MTGLLHCDLAFGSSIRVYSVSESERAGLHTMHGGLLLYSWFRASKAFYERTCTGDER